MPNCYRKFFKRDDNNFVCLSRQSKRSIAYEEIFSSIKPYCLYVEACQVVSFKCNVYVQKCLSEKAINTY